jgi:hypothetical protein
MRITIIKFPTKCTVDFPNKTEVNLQHVFKKGLICRHGMCFRIIHFILISTVYALFLTCLPVSISGT